MRPPLPQLLITDLDNTIYDWVTFFARSFDAMVKALCPLLRVDEEQLLDEFKVIHQLHGNSEHPWAALELPSVRQRFGHRSRSDLRDQLAPAFLAFNQARDQHLRLYDGVEYTLSTLASAGVRIVAHTEAIAANAYYRVQKLGVTRYLSRIYALEGNLPPHPDSTRQAYHRPPPNLIVELPKSERKPNPQMLDDICSRENIPKAATWYVGDSLTRDISMATTAGVLAVWAQYGTYYDQKLWDILVRVTHWTPEDVAREQALRRRYSQIVPDYTIERFDEILTLARIVPRARTVSKA